MGPQSHVSHSHASTPSGSPLHAPRVVFRSPHRYAPSSHHHVAENQDGIQPVIGAGGNGAPLLTNIPSSPIPPPPNNIGNEISDTQPGKMFIRKDTKEEFN